MSRESSPVANSPFRSPPHRPAARPQTRWGALGRLASGAALMGGLALGANAAHDHAIDKEHTAQLQESSGESWHILNEREVGEAAHHVGRRLINGQLLGEAHTRDEAERTIRSITRQYLRTAGQFNADNTDAVVRVLQDALNIIPDSGSLALGAIEATRDATTEEAFARLDQTFTGFNQTPKLLDRIQALRIALDANNGAYVAHTLREAYQHRGGQITQSELDAVISLCLRQESSASDIRYIHQALQADPEVWEWFTNTVIPKVDHLFQDRNNWNNVTTDPRSQNQFEYFGRFTSFLPIRIFEVTQNDAVEAREAAATRRPQGHNRHHSGH